MLPNDSLIYCNVFAAQSLEEPGRSAAAAGRCSDSRGSIPHCRAVTLGHALLYPEEADTASLFCCERSARQTTPCLPKINSAASLHTFLSRVVETLPFLPNAVLERWETQKCLLISRLVKRRFAIKTPECSSLFPSFGLPTHRLSLLSSWEGCGHHLTFVSYLELLSWMYLSQGRTQRQPSHK